jgi:hypothetical protein
MKLVFSEYLKSKEKLREAVHKTPQVTKSYKVTRHCRLMVQSSDGKQYLPLNPGVIISIVWLYQDRRTPLPLRISFEGVNSIEEGKKFYTSWGSDKLEKWLKKNTESK